MSDKSVGKKEIKGAMLEVMHDFWQEMLEPKLNKIDSRLDSLEKDTVEIKKDVRQNTYLIKQNSRKIDDIKVDLANTPTRKELNTLKARVNLHNPIN